MIRYHKITNVYAIRGKAVQVKISS